MVIKDNAPERAVVPPLAPRRERPTSNSGRVDPYGWMTDPADPPLAAYLQAERDYYDARTAGLRPLVDELAAEMVARVPDQEPSAPWEQGGYRYQYVYPAGADHPRLVRSAAGGAARTLLDLQRVADAGGTGYCETGLVQVSPDGQLLAWSVDLSGDEVYELRFRDLRTGRDLVDVVPRSYYGGAWSADSSAFLYTVHDDAYRPYQVRRHVLGTDPADDPVVLEEDDERFEVEVDASRTGAWVVIRLVARGTTEEWLLASADLAAAPEVVRSRQTGVEYALEHAPGHGPDGEDGFLVVTNLGAPEFRLAWAPVTDPARWTEVLAEDPAVRLHGVDAFAGGYLLSVRQDGAAALRVHPSGAAPYPIRCEVAGGMARMGRNEEYDSDTATVVLESFLDPAVHLDVTLATGARAERHRSVAVGVEGGAYRSERLLVPRPDGAQVPVVVMRHRDTDLNGTAPCLLYGYGSYEASCDPDWGIDWWRTLPSLLDRGVVFAVGHPRGGGEQGRRWWLDGHLGAKPNTFDDQAAVADFLADGPVDGARIVTRGLSAGGLLQGALYGRRPDRFAGVLAEVPFVDVITTMLDPSLPLTVTEWEEWGDPREPDAYEVMASYSPIDNRPPVAARPPLLATGAVHDPRVLVREPAKWVAALRHDDPDAGRGTYPGSPVSPRTVLFRCETGAGAHAGPPGRYGQLHYEAEVLAWCLAAMGAAVPPAR